MCTLGSEGYSGLYYLQDKVGMLVEECNFLALIFKCLFYLASCSWVGVRSRLYNNGQNMLLWTGSVIDVRIAPKLF